MGRRPEGLSSTRTQRSQVVGKSGVIPPSVCTTSQAFVHQKSEPSDQFTLRNFADP